MVVRWKIICIHRVVRCSRVSHDCRQSIQIEHGPKIIVYMSYYSNGRNKQSTLIKFRAATGVVWL